MQPLCVAAELSALEPVRAFVGRHAAACGLGSEAAYDLTLAVDELVTNIIVHGYRGRAGTIEVEARPAGDALTIVLRDAAPPFDPVAAPAPDTTLPLERRGRGGMGIHIARSFVDSLRHTALPQGGNELTLVKKIAVRAPPAEDTQWS